MGARYGSRSFKFKRLCIISATIFSLTELASAQSYSVVYNFLGGSQDGSHPSASLIQSGTTLYGTEVCT